MYYQDYVMVLLIRFPAKLPYLICVTQHNLSKYLSEVPLVLRSFITFFLNCFKKGILKLSFWFECWFHIRTQQEVCISAIYLNKQLINAPE